MIYYPIIILVSFALWGYGSDYGNESLELFGMMMTAAFAFMNVFVILPLTISKKNKLNAKNKELVEYQKECEELEQIPSFEQWLKQNE